MSRRHPGNGGDRSGWDAEQPAPPDPVIAGPPAGASPALRAAWAGQRAADHAMGLELQLEELTEQRRRAEVQGRLDDAARLDTEITALHSELARTAEWAAAAVPPPA